MIYYSAAAAFVFFLLLLLAMNSVGEVKDKAKVDYLAEIKSMQQTNQLASLDELNHLFRNQQIHVKPTDE